MEKEKLCVFCGQRPGPFRSTNVLCGGSYQYACKSCEKELQDLDELELCRRALRFGLAENPKRLEERIALITEAENHRPNCPQCGGKLTFSQQQMLDNSPMRDGLLSSTFDVQPAVCHSCGKLEFYDPYIARKNKYIAYLIRKDTQG